MKALLLLTLITLSLVAAEPGVLTWSGNLSTNVYMNVQIGTDVATGARFLLVNNSTGIALIPLPSLPPEPTPPKPVEVIMEDVMEIDPNKMKIETGETYKYMANPSEQVKKLAKGGWKVVGEYCDANGFMKCKIQRITKK